MTGWHDDVADGSARAKREGLERTVGVTGQLVICGGRRIAGAGDHDHVEHAAGSAHDHVVEHHTGAEHDLVVDGDLRTACAPKMPPAPAISPR
jgi:hypothetical protein